MDLIKDKNFIQAWRLFSSLDTFLSDLARIEHMPLKA